MTLPTAKMALLHAKARSLAICSHKPQKTATYNGLVSRFAGESRGHSEKTMCRQRDRKSVGYGKSVSVRVDIGGRRIIKNKIAAIRQWQRGHGNEKHGKER